jgi:hypothetical protein
VPGGYNWATLSLGDLIQGPDSPAWGKEVINLTESSKEGYGSKRVVLQMMMMVPF